MPAGTIFAKGEPWHFSDLSFKGESLENDFVCLSLVNIESADSGEWADRLFEMLERGASYPADSDGFGRDGCFDDEELFLVFEKNDLLMLRARIDEALSVFVGKSETCRE